MILRIQRSWLRHQHNITHHYFLSRLLNAPTKLAQLQKQKFNGCVIFIKIEQLDRLKSDLPKIRELLESESHILLMVPNNKNQYSRFSYNFVDNFNQKFSAQIRWEYNITRYKRINAGFTWIGRAMIEHINKKFAHHRTMKLLTYVLLGFPASLICFMRSFMPINTKIKQGHCTNLLLTLAPYDKGST